MTLVHWILIALLTVPLANCASAPEEPQGHPHRATMVNDIFAVEQGMPIREVKKDRPFFFKKCESTTTSRHPFFSKTEYQCSTLPTD